MNGNRSVAIIPARFRSSRLPGKPLRVISGRTLIEHVYRRVEMVRGLDRVAQREEQKNWKYHRGLNRWRSSDTFARGSQQQQLSLAQREPRDTVRSVK